MNQNYCQILIIQYILMEMAAYFSVLSCFYVYLFIVRAVATKLRPPSPANTVTGDSTFVTASTNTTKRVGWTRLGLSIKRKLLSQRAVRLKPAQFVYSVKRILASPWWKRLVAKLGDQSNIAARTAKEALTGLTILIDMRKYANWANCRQKGLKPNAWGPVLCVKEDFSHRNNWEGIRRLVLSLMAILLWSILKESVPRSL